MKNLLLIICAGFFAQGFSQGTYQNLIPSGESDYVQGMIMTSDNAVITYMNVAANGSFLNTLISKVNKAGNYSWSKVFAVKDYRIHTESIVPTSNGDFIAVASTDSIGKKTAFIIFKVDSSGTVVWKKKLEPNKPDDYFGSPTIAGAKDGGFYLMNSLYPVDYILSRYDKQGVLKWSSTFKFNDNDYGTELDGLKEAPDGRLITLFGIRGCEGYCFHLEMDVFNRDGSGGFVCSFNMPVYSFGTPVFAGDEKGDVHILSRQSIDNYHSYYSYVTIKPDSNKIVALNIDDNVYALQRFLRVNKLTMFQQQPFDANHLSAFDADWGLIQAYGYRTNKTNNIKIDKYDSIGRICPDYTIPKASYTVIQKAIGLNAYRFKIATIPVPPLTDVTITTTPQSSMITLCSGSANEGTIIPFAKSAMVDNTAAHLAPNPATNNCVLYINTIQTEKLVISMTDMSGKLITVKTVLLQKGSNKITLNVQAVPGDMYLIRLQSNTIQKTLKLIKL